MEEKKYTKLSNLVGQVFTVDKVWGFKWKKWDEATHKMLSSDTYVQDFQKRYDVVTDQGQMDLSQSQFASMLEGVSKAGVADVNGRSFSVKSNGKTGMDIRYWINPVAQQQPTQTKEEPEEESAINLDEIPF